MSVRTDDDVLGSALLDFLNDRINENENIIVTSDIGEKDIYPLHYFFRSFNDMPLIEKKALRCTEGKILDVGAGAGVHSLILQETGFDVTAIDTSPGCVQAMKKLGINRAICTDFFQLSPVMRFDTILLLMNGLGIVGERKNLPAFFEKAYDLLYPGGQILLDSSDISYMYEEEDGSEREDLYKDYKGEVIYTMHYKDTIGKPFKWLYMPFDELLTVAKAFDFKGELLMEKENHYLARFSIDS